MASRKVNGFPLEIRDVEPEEVRNILDLFHGSMKEFIRVGPKGYFVPKEFEHHICDIYNMPLRPTDTFVCSYPRSGTTWTQELVWLVANNLDYDKAASLSLSERYPFLEEAVLVNARAKEIFLEKSTDISGTQEFLKESILTPTEKIASTPDPRFVKTHLPFSLLHPTLLDTAKVVYVARDPRDVIVSFYHLVKMFTMWAYKSSFKQLWDLFTKNMCLFLTPYFEHVKEAWELRHHSNMLFIFYEELSSDMTGSIRRVCSFLGKEYTEEQISGLCEHLKFEKFKNNKSVNIESTRNLGMLENGETFIRKGKVGEWRRYFDEEMTQQAEQWIRDNLRDTDLRFPSMSDMTFN